MIFRGGCNTAPQIRHIKGVVAIYRKLNFIIVGVDRCVDPVLGGFIVKGGHAGPPLPINLGANNNDSFAIWTDSHCQFPCIFCK